MLSSNFLKVIFLEKSGLLFRHHILDCDCMSFFIIRFRKMLSSIEWSQSSWNHWALAPRMLCPRPIGEQELS